MHYLIKYSFVSHAVDPPQNVYGNLTLVSPEKASLVLSFRPPASHPKLINSFTFEFSNQNEKIIYKIKNDGVRFYLYTTPYYFLNFLTPIFVNLNRSIQLSVNRIIRPSLLIIFYPQVQESVNSFTALLSRIIH